MLLAALCLSFALPGLDPLPVDFDTQIVALLTRSGCNSGACHGAAAGCGGFRLSLLGERPKDDYQAIVFELEGRRVNLVHADKSLLYAKPTGMLSHGGGEPIEYGSRDAELLLRWLGEGARRLPSTQLTGFRIEPARILARQPGDSIPLTAWATFADGTTRDVTDLTSFSAADTEAVRLRAGSVQLNRRGPSTLIARYLDRVVAVPIILPYRDDPIEISSQPRHNWIDEFALAALQELHLPVAGKADDATFLRRVRIDLTGTLPGIDEFRQFVHDGDPNKRTKLIDRLMVTEEFADYWTLRWSNWLRLSSRTMGSEGTVAFHRWLRGQIAANAPLDEMARTLLTSVGNSHEIGPANFARATPDARNQAEHVSELFMGVRLGCANCHNHPLDRWTQDDYHGLAAIFARLERGQFVQVAKRGEVTHPRTGAAATPRLPGERFLQDSEDGRGAFAHWLTSPEAPYFARSMVNRFWQAMLGRGLVEPVDDMRATNPATHPELLDRLAAEFVAHGYDARHIIRLIANSAVYSRAGQVKRPLDNSHFADFRPKPLEPEVLADALARVTGVSDAYGSLPAGTRAIQLHDSRIPSLSLDILGRCTREGPCGSSAVAGGLPAKLHWINGPLINAKLRSPNGRLQLLLAAGATDETLLKEFYLAALGRFARPEERQTWLRLVSASGSAAERCERWEDLVWALLSSQEFVTNH